MSNYYAPCFYKIDFVVILSYIELPWFKKSVYFYVTVTENFERFQYFNFERTFLKIRDFS